jgi:hypothetical protein
MAMSSSAASIDAPGDAGAPPDPLFADFENFTAFFSFFQCEAIAAGLPLAVGCGGCDGDGFDRRYFKG